MTTDIFITHPRDLFYPLWVKRMNENRDLFDRLIVVITQKGSERNFTKDIIRSLKDVIIIREYYDNGKDWRHAALSRAMQVFVADRALFLEQDFLMGKGFLKKLLSYNFNTIGFEEGNRFHPACLLVKREALDKTNKDFSVDPDVSDHFGKLSKELRNIGDCHLLKDLDLPEYYHMSGLSQNYRLTENFHTPDDFFLYNILCENLEQPQEWKDFCKQFRYFSPCFPETKVKKFFYE